MIIGIVVLWGAYALGMWGYCLVRGYNVTPKDVLNYKFPSKVTAAGGPTAQQIAATSPGSSAQQAAAQGVTPSLTHPGSTGARTGPVPF